MSKLILTLMVLALAAITGSALADDGVRAEGKTTETHGRALDEVKAAGKARDAHGRTITPDLPEGCSTRETGCRPGPKR